MSMEKFNGGVDGHAHKVQVASSCGNYCVFAERTVMAERLPTSGAPKTIAGTQARPVDKFVRQGQRKPLRRLLVLAVFPARRTTSDDGEVDRKNGLKMR